MTTATANPTVDVVIPLYNGSRFVAQALRSITDQTVPPQRVIVIDDGSTDDSAGAVQGFKDGYHGVVSIELSSTANHGPNAARNTGIALSTATYVALLDADDAWEPTKLERQLERMTSTEEPALVYCGYYEMNEAGQRIEGGRIVRPELRGKVFATLLKENRISGSSSAVLLRRSVLESIGHFDETMRGSEDHDMWLRIAQLHNIDFVPEDLVAIRRHASSAQTDVALMLRNMLVFYTKWFPFAKDDREVCRHWGHLIAEFTRRSADPEHALAMVNTELTRDMRQHFFDRTYGSLRAYLLLKRISAMRSKTSRS